MDTIEQILKEWRGQRPDLDPSPIGVFGRLRQVSELTRQELEAFLAPYHLTPKSFDVLANLRRGGPPYRKTPSQLADSSLLSSGAMTGRLDNLERQGLIRRTPDPGDRRVTFAELTPAGVELIDQVFTLHLAKEESMLDGLTAEQCDQIADSLALLEQAVRNLSAQHTRLPRQPSAS
jgi:DNA-binding MarR family transcriptional regulator